MPVCGRSGASRRPPRGPTSEQRAWGARQDYHDHEQDSDDNHGQVEAPTRMEPAASVDNSFVSNKNLATSGTDGLVCQATPDASDPEEEEEATLPEFRHHEYSPEDLKNGRALWDRSGFETEPSHVDLTTVCTLQEYVNIVTRPPQPYTPKLSEFLEFAHERDSHLGYSEADIDQARSRQAIFHEIASSLTEERERLS